MANQIHPAAMVDPSAKLGDGVKIGPYAVIESDVVIGDGCELKTGAVIRRYTTMGSGNVVHPYAVLGGEPQDRKFAPGSRTYLRIGSNNIIREHVTISRATTPESATVIGDKCLFMTQSHAGHDCRIGNGVILTNNAALAGHVEVGDGVILSANAAVHQFCWVGRGVMARGNSAATQHVPPFCLLKGFNEVCGLNTVGMRRAGDLTDEDRQQVKDAYALVYRSSLSLAEAVARMDEHAEWGPAAADFREFTRRVATATKPHDRGLVTARRMRRR